VDVATGSLGQGLCAGSRHRPERAAHRTPHRTYVLLGDGETAEGSVWEAAQAASFDRLDSLCGIVDVNAYGQSGPTLWQHDLEALAGALARVRLARRVVDGHDVEAILDALDEPARQGGRR
jgi:transketolase